MRDPKDVIAGMQPWYEKVEGMSAREKRAWSSAILTAAELVRRLDDYDETRGLAIHGLLAYKLPCPAPVGPAPASAVKEEA